MRTSKIDGRPIDQVANEVTRDSSESENIDLAAEATDSAPAKSLAADQPGKPQVPTSNPTPRRSKSRP